MTHIAYDMYHTTEQYFHVFQNIQLIIIVTISIMFLIFMEFIGVALVNKIVFKYTIHNTSSVYCILCSPPKLSLFLSPFNPPLLSSTSLYPFSSSNHHTIVCIYEFCFVLFCFLLNPFDFFT